MLQVTGRKAGLMYGPAIDTAPPARPAGMVECENEQPDDPSVVRCYRCRENKVGPGGVLCVLCRLDMEATTDFYSGVNWAALGTNLLPGDRP